MHYKQQKNYGCGLYAIANVLQNDAIITHERLEASKKGNNIGQLNRWLEQSGYELWISVIQYNNEKPIYICDFEIDFSIDESVVWHPFFITIKSTHKKNHMLGCRYMRNGNIIVHDSLKDEEDIFDSFQDFREYYDGKILSFEHFCNYDGLVASMVELN